MKISTKVSELMNKQINNEMYSAYLYLSMSAYFEAENLPGFASWMKKQAEEEVEHGMKFFDFINERAGEVKLDAIGSPKLKWKSPLEAFQDAYEHEMLVTSQINKIYEAALAEKDYASTSFLNWFVDEQVEEEDSALAIVEKLKLAGDNKGALLMLDKELGSRE